MSIELITVAAGIFLGVVHYLSDYLRPKNESQEYCIISFAAGISIAYLFLSLLPHTYEAAERLKEWVFVFLLLGFTLFHIIEKFTYKHADKKKLARELKEIHSAAFFVYHFLIGTVLVHEFHVEIMEGLLFLITISLHAALSTASLSRVHGEVRESKGIKIILSLSSLLGVGFALLVSVPPVVDNILISIIAGILLYIIVKEFLPEKEKGRPLFFMLGMLLFVAVYVVIRLS